MNAEEIKLKIDSLEKELESLKGKLKEKMESEWPQRGDFYYYCIFRGNHESAYDWYRSMWEDHDIDFRRKEFNNIFPTMDEAKKEASYLTFEGQVRAKAKELNDGWVADHSDDRQTKYKIMTAISSSSCYIDCDDDDSPLIRGSECKSKKVAQALLDHFGAEKFLACATGGDL